MPKVMRVGGSDKAPRRVFISIPTYNGAIGAECFVSVAPALGALEKAGIGWELCVETGNCHVDDSRNSAVQQFFLTDCTDLVFIDDDVGFKPSDLVRLVQYECDGVLAGIYPKKQDESDFPVRTMPGEIWGRADGLVEVEGVATGFMRIPRRCLEQLCDTHKDRSWIGGSGGVYHPIFERGIFNGERLSGDYAFCRKWKELGGRIFVDPEMRFTHTGAKTWEGTLADFWRKRARIPSPRLMEAIARLKKGEATHEVFSIIFDAWDNPASVLPDHMMAIYRMAKRAKGRVLEAGSGITTLIMAAAGAEVHSLEHDLLWFEKVQRILAANDLKATVHYAPMKDYDGFVWYSVPEALPESFAFVLCDGPNRDYGRSGLFRILKDRIKDAEWSVDDCDDGGQLAMLNHYAEGRDIHLLGTDGMKKFALALKAA